MKPRVSVPFFGMHSFSENKCKFLCSHRDRFAHNNNNIPPVQKYLLKKPLVGTVELLADFLARFGGVYSWYATVVSFLQQTTRMRLTFEANFLRGTNSLDRIWRSAHSSGLNMFLIFWICPANNEKDFVKFLGQAVYRFETAETKATTQPPHTRTCRLHLPWF